MYMYRYLIWQAKEFFQRVRRAKKFDGGDDDFFFVSDRQIRMMTPIRMSTTDIR